MNEIDENKKNLIKIGIYGGFLLIIVLLAAFSNRTNKPNTNNETQLNDNNPIIEQIKNINDKYYTAKIHLTLDDDAETLEYQKLDEIEIGIKKYHGETQEYTKYNNTYYKVENQEFIKIPDFKDFDYDKTFTIPSNIKKLLEKNGTKSTYKMNDLTVLKIDYKLADVLAIYNQYNNIDIIQYIDGTINLEIYYKEDEIEYIKINITSLYNYLNEKELENVTYKIEIKEDKEEDTSWIIEKIKKNS